MWKSHVLFDNTTTIKLVHVCKPPPKVKEDLRLPELGFLNLKFYWTFKRPLLKLIHNSSKKKDIPAMDGFHSRDLQPCGTQMTKAMTVMLVHITKEVH